MRALGGTALQPVVRVRDAAVRLGGRLIWHHVSLDVAPGEFIAVLGPNGAGKSTLIKAILGLVPLSGGSIAVNGSSPQRGRRSVGYVPQRRSFGPDVHVRGRDLVRLGLDGTRWGIPLPGIRALWGGGRRVREERERVRRAIEMVGAAAYADRPIGELSGGEQQRLLIAQALVTRPRILLLDEPLDSLDLRNQQEVSAVIRRISAESETAVLLVAHDVNPLLPYVDRLCYIAQGHVAVGRPQEVITTETLTRLYGAPVEVLHTRDGRLVVVGQPEGMPCTDYHGGHEH
ncbi:MAG: ABC transporter ATP-binding protein [Chloroflexi bacterium]|nr:ABC transporter ATP-binding protein [Chloroflexota bacterium]